MHFDPSDNPESRLTRRRALQLLGATALVPLVPGCARLPEGSTGGNGSGRLVNVTLTVNGAILQNSLSGRNFYYFFLFNLTDNSTDPGPIPVITAPFGNGFAAPNNSTKSNGQRAQGFIGFVLYSPVFIGGSGFGLYRVPVDPSDSTQFVDVTTLSLNGGFTGPSAVDSATPVAAGSSTLNFRLNLKNLLPTGTTTTTLPRYLQFNIITTDNLPQGGDTSVQKLWDALGNGLQAESTNTDSQLAPYLIADITQNAVYRNSDFQGNSSKYEVQGDVYNQGFPVSAADFPTIVPGLDIVDWTVQITSG